MENLEISKNENNQNEKGTGNQISDEFEIIENPNNKYSLENLEDNKNNIINENKIENQDNKENNIENLIKSDIEQIENNNEIEINILNKEEDKIEKNIENNQIEEEKELEKNIIQKENENEENIENKIEDKGEKKENKNDIEENEELENIIKGKDDENVDENENEKEDIINVKDNILEFEIESKDKDNVHEDKTDNINIKEYNSSKIKNLKNEEDNKKLSGKNLNERYNSELTNIEEKQETSKITGDIEMKDSSSNNLIYLGNLFRDLVNKYEEKGNMKETRKLIRKTISKKNKISDNQETEQQPFNFNDIINIQLNEAKQNTLSYLEKAKNELDKRYSLYIKKINNYINENELKISKVIPDFESNENFINYADENIFKQIDYLLEIHENIFSALEDHINLLFTFLDQISLIKQKNPFEHFLNSNSNEILNCWFLSKIDFNKLSLSNVIINKDLSDLVSGYLCKKKENNFAKITIQKDTKGNLSLESEFLRDNINNLEKLKFLGLSSNAVNDILKNINTKNKKKINDDNIQIGKKLHSLSIIESNFCHNELPKFSLPILRKAKIKKSDFPLNYLFESIIGQTSFLKIIDIQNCKINDKDFLEFFYYLGQKKYLQDSLQYLGFSGNELTYINLKKFILKGGELKNLQYFDLSKNNIHEFVTDNFKSMPALKVLDLSDNNISNYEFFNSINALYRKSKMLGMVLLSNNIFVSNNKKNNLNYRKYIYKILSTFKYKIKRVNLSLLYNKDNIEELTTLRISPWVKISLVKLNLSYCGLKTETLWKFFQNNFGLLNLVSLNLAYNFISNSFFSLCAGKDILLEKLKEIDLSMNLISCKDMKEIKQIEIFINNYQKLKKIKVQRNEFTKDLVSLYQNYTQQLNEIVDSLKKKGIKFCVDIKYDVIIKDKLKDIIELKDKNI